MKLISFLGLIFFTALARLVPHLPNFTPLGAMALYAGANVGGRKAFLLPILTMLFSDLILGFHSTMIFVYGSFALTVLIGRIIRTRQGIKNVAFAAFSSSIIFFLITNFGVWLMSGMYPHNFQGLMTAFAMGILFFRNTLLGDMFFSAAFFGGAAVVSICFSKIKSKIVSPFYAGSGHSTSGYSTSGVE
jgi:hypothetical protein